MSHVQEGVYGQQIIHREKYLSNNLRGWLVTVQRDSIMLADSNKAGQREDGIEGRGLFESIFE